MEKTPAGSPLAATARVTAAATISEVPGWASCALTTTGQPAASAEAVSPPATEKASGKLLAANTATGPTGTRRCAHVGPPGGLAVGQRVIDPRPVPASLPQRGGEQPELTGGPRHLAGEPGQREAGLVVGALGGGLAHGVDLVGGELEQAGALLDRSGAEGLERGLGQLGRAGDELAGGEPVGGVERGAIAGIDRAEGPGVAEDGLTGEVHRADDTRERGLGFGCHGSSVSLLFNAALLLFYQRAGPGDAAGAAKR